MDVASYSGLFTCSYSYSGLVKQLHEAKETIYAQTIYVVTVQILSDLVHKCSLLGPTLASLSSSFNVI